jgi:hypothetical protein
VIAETGKVEKHFDDARFVWAPEIRSAVLKRMPG